MITFDALSIFLYLLSTKIFGTLIIMLQRILTGIPNKTYSVEKVQYLWKIALSENRSSKLRTEVTANQGYSKCVKTCEKYKRYTNELNHEMYDIFT